jgi:multidrug efflux pump subunit AcrB
VSGGIRSALVTALAALGERRLAVGALTAAVAILGVIALVQMPLQLLPEIRYPQIRVISDISGQTSRVIEESVNEPIEAALAGIPGIVQLESRSGDGRSYLDLFFAPGYDLDRGLRDVTQAVQRAQTQIPPDFPEPRIFAVSTMEDPVIQYAFGSSTLSAPEIRQRLRANLLPRLRAIPGVEAVYMGREEVPELVVEIDPHRHAAVGVGFDALESTLLRATEPPPSSAMRTPGFEGIVVLDGSGWEAARMESLPVPVAGTSHSIPLGSFATVHRSPSEVSLRVRLDGEPAVLVSVHRALNAHSLRMAREVRAVVDELGATEPFAELEPTLLFDDSVVTRSAVWSVMTAAGGGAFLAMLLLFFALRQRRYVPLVAMVVGMSLLATIIALHGLGESLNLLTLAGLLLSVGLGLDYAIIYFDRLDRLGGRVKDAHLQAMADVVGPLLGALLTTLAAVLPFLLVEGMVALLFRPLILTVVVAAVFSFLFAVVLLPVMVREGEGLAPPAASPDPGPPAPQPRWWSAAQRPPVAWAGVAVAAGILLLGGRALPFEVLPVVDDGFVEGRIVHPAGITPAELDGLARRAESALSAVPGTEAVFSTVGGYFREGLPTHRPGRTDLLVRVNPREAGSSETWADAARSALRALEVPGLQVSITPPRIRGVQTRLADADLIVVLTREDGNILELAEVETRVMELLQGVPGLLDVQRLRSGVSPRWVAEPRYEVLAANGVDPGSLARTVTYSLEGRVIRQRMHQGEPLALRVRFDRRAAGGPAELERARLPSVSGGDVHLGDVVNFRLVEEPTHIERREGQRVVRVAARLDPAGPGPGAVGAAVEDALTEAGLPDGVGWWLEGELDALRETSRTFGVSLVLALAMVLTLLVVQYGSLSFALAGLITIPLSGAGAVVLLGVLSRPLDAMVLAGLLIAVGIVANNVILVLSRAKEATEGPRPTPLDQALQAAARERLRPITLTVLSTVLGMSPLLVGGAEVFGLLQPLAIALTGALLLSVPLACLALPGIAVSLARLVR